MCTRPQLLFISGDDHFRDRSDRTSTCRRSPPVRVPRKQRPSARGLVLDSRVVTLDHSTAPPRTASIPGR